MPPSATGDAAALLATVREMGCFYCHCTILSTAWRWLRPRCSRQRPGSAAPALVMVSSWRPQLSSWTADLKLPSTHAGSSRLHDAELQQAAVLPALQLLAQAHPEVRWRAAAAAAEQVLQQGTERCEVACLHENSCAGLHSSS